MARVEAVLFVAGEPLSSRKIAQFASLADGTEARTLIRRLNRYLDSQGSAFRVEELAGGYQLLTRPKFGGWLRRLHRAPVEARLSAPALETLVVVAYRQPVVRAEIEAVRGVQCGEILRQLMERDLVRIIGKSDELGRPFLYGTTQRFLQVFGLRHLDELPRADLLKAEGVRTPTNKSTAARRDDELTPTSELNEEPHVMLAATREPGEDLLNLTAVVPNLLRDHAKNEADDFEYEDEDDDDEDEDVDDEDEDLDDEDEDEDFEDDDLEDDEWEEVDDEDEWDEDEDEDEDEDDWDDDEDEDEEEDWDEGE